MISIKPGASIIGVKSEILLALMIVNSVFEKNGFNCTITEGTGGHHMQGSKHYLGEAFDIRSKDVPTPFQKQVLLEECKAALGVEFTMIIEDEGLDNEHFHVQQKG